MRLPWLESRDESRGARAALAPLVPLSWLYARGAALHRSLYERGVLRRTRLPLRVVSVGSPLVGGSGKTPLAAWIAAALSARGRAVAIASRGFRGTPEDRVVVVSDGRFVMGRAESAGDEALVLAAAAPGVPVLVGRDRGVAGWRALSAYGAEVLVLDDGFQHHRLARDVEVVALDGRFGFGNGRVLPRGPLRESPSCLSRADVVAVVDGPCAASDDERLDGLAPHALRIDARRVPVALRPLGGGPSESPRRLSGARVGLLAGIARPAAFRHTLEALGAEIAAERTFPDHHAYRPRDLAGLADEAPVWITTEKDAAKIRPLWARPARVRVLAVRLEVERAEGFLDWLDARLAQEPAAPRRASR